MATIYAQNDEFEVKLPSIQKTLSVEIVGEFAIYSIFEL